MHFQPYHKDSPNVVTEVVDKNLQPYQENSPEVVIEEQGADDMGLWGLLACCWNTPFVVKKPVLQLGPEE